MVNLQITRWRPDSCDCVIEYEWDRDLAGDVRTHTGKNIVKDCPDHSGLGTPQNFFNAVLNENQRKNNFLNDIELDPSLSSLVSKAFDTVDGKLVPLFTWSFSGINDARILNIDTTNTTLSQNEKNTIQTFVDSKFGVGKVSIN